MRKHYWSTIALLIMIVLAAGSVDTKRTSTETTASSSKANDSSSIIDTSDSVVSSELDAEQVYSAQLQQFQSEYRVWVASKDARDEAERELRRIELEGTSLADEKPIKPYYGTREWETRDGKYKTQAELIETDNVTVTLRKSDGKIVTVPKETLIHSSRLIVETAFTELSAYKIQLSKWEDQSSKIDDLRRTAERKFTSVNKPEPQPPSREKIVSEITAKNERESKDRLNKKLAADAKNKLEIERRKNADIDELKDFIRSIDPNRVLFVDVKNRYSIDGAVTIFVSDTWHIEHYQRRLQNAQRLFQVWETIRSSGEQSGNACIMTIADLNGNEVGGTGLLGVWVQKD